MIVITQYRGQDDGASLGNFIHISQVSGIDIAVIIDCMGKALEIL